MNVLIADDQKLLRESLKNAIENNSGIHVAGCVTNGNEAYNFCDKFIPDIVLMDLSMPICSGAKATKMIKEKYPRVKVLILTASNDESDVDEAIRNGADGYILKDVGTEELILSIKSSVAGLGIIHRDVLSSVFNKNKHDKENSKSKLVKLDGIDVSLTERELKIIEMIIDGNDNKKISSELLIAEGTVKNTITEMLSKLHLKDRTGLVLFAIKNNLVSL